MTEPLDSTEKLKFATAKGNAFLLSHGERNLYNVISQGNEKIIQEYITETASLIKDLKVALHTIPPQEKLGHFLGAPQLDAGEQALKENVLGLAVGLILERGSDITDAEALAMTNLHALAALMLQARAVLQVTIWWPFDSVEEKEKYLPKQTKENHSHGSGGEGGI